MVLVLILALVLAVGLWIVGMALIFQKLADRRVAAWRRAAGPLGFRVEVKPDGNRLMRGELAGLPVRVYEAVQSYALYPRGGLMTSVEVGPIPWLPRQAEISRPRLIRAGARLPRVKTGDARFDAVVHAFGPRSTLLPLLDYDARRALLLAFDEGDVRIDSGRLTLRRAGAVFTTERLVRMVRRSEAIVAGLDPEGRTAVEQLCKTARREPVAGAREVALEELARHHHDESPVRELARELASSGRAGRRVMALGLLGAAGVPVAEEVVVDPRADDEARARARAFLDLHGRGAGAERAGRLALAEEQDPDAVGGLSAAAGEGELALAEE